MECSRLFMSKRYFELKKCCSMDFMKKRLQLDGV